MLFIAGDIGGTKVRLGIYDSKDSRLCLHEEKYASREFSDFASLLKKFLENNPFSPITVASLGIAGPVQNDICKATNLPWVISARELEKELGIPHVFLINDLEANAWGLRCLQKEEFFVLNEGEERIGNQGLISVGTGLGEAGLYWDGKTHIPFACEGGHCDFAPTDEEEIEILRYLKKQNTHVSFERLLSGSGIYQIYRFLVDTKREKENPEIATLEKEPQRIISEKALKKECPTCIRSCEIFTNIYGSEAGNLALKYLSIGGMYVGGGVAPQLTPFFQEGHRFMKAFINKGRLSSLLMKIPIKIVLNDKTALLGAVRYGQEKIV